MNEHEVRTTLFPVLTRQGINDAKASIQCCGGNPSVHVETIEVIASGIDTHGDRDAMIECLNSSKNKQDAIQRLDESGLMRS